MAYFNVYNGIFPNGEQGVTVDKYPDECPQCASKISVQPNTGRLQMELPVCQLQIVFHCPNKECQKLFISNYNFVGGAGRERKFDFVDSQPWKPTDRLFEAEIRELSPEFVVIYNQARHAEQLELHQICGVGYRKAIEFLIKDYLINRTHGKEDEIKKKFLGKCISDDIENPQILQMAKRATWLGNDETHYERKWIDKDLKDLKRLIDLTLHWISMEKMTEEYKEKMPENKESLSKVIV